MSRSIVSRNQPSDISILGRDRTPVQPGGPIGRARNTIDFNGIQPDFIRAIISPTGRQRVGISVDELNRGGDVRAEDIFPGSIDTIHIKNAAITSAKIDSIDAGIVTISSADGKLQITGNVISIDDGSDVRQVTLGKYDGTNYGIAFGSNPSNPDVLITDSEFKFRTAGFAEFGLGSDLIFRNLTETVQTFFGYVINNFQIIGDSTNGVTIPLLTIGGDANPSYGSASGGVFIADASSSPSGTPTDGIILYSENGALYYKGEDGSKAVLAPPGVKVITNSDSPYTVINEDMYILADATSGNITLNLVAANANESRIFFIKKTDSSANTVTVTRAGSDTIEGATTYVLSAQYDSVTLISHGGSAWWIISST